MQDKTAKRGKRKGYLAAMVVGTALSALGAAPAAETQVAAIDTVKKRTQRGRKLVSLDGAVADNRDAGERCMAEERDAVRQAAAAALTPKQQQIVEMSFEGWSVADIAKELNLPPARVSDEK